MKKQVSPMAMVICIVFVVILAIALGVRTLSPPAAVEKKASADKPLMMNGQRVPGGAPIQYLQQMNQGGGGSQSNGVAPRDMTGGTPGQMPTHP